MRPLNTHITHAGMNNIGVAFCRKTRHNVLEVKRRKETETRDPHPTRFPGFRQANKKLRAAAPPKNLFRCRDKDRRHTTPQASAQDARRKYRLGEHSATRRTDSERTGRQARTNATRAHRDAANGDLDGPKTETKPENRRAANRKPRGEFFLRKFCLMRSDDERNGQHFRWIRKECTWIRKQSKRLGEGTKSSCVNETPQRRERSASPQRRATNCSSALAWRCQRSRLILTCR